MSPGKGDPVAPPPGTGEYVIRYDSRKAVEGWRELGRQAPGNTYRAWLVMRTSPAPGVPTERHARLKGSLAVVLFRGEALPQWQYEVTGGGRIWYLVDERRRIVWLVRADTGHPKETE